MCRLDRFLVSNEWEDLYPQFMQEALPKITSDYWPTLLTTTHLQYGSGPFRFENMWTLHASFKDCIKKWWNECKVYGWKGFCFMKKLQYVKNKLIVWNKHLGYSKSTRKGSRRQFRILTIEWKSMWYWWKM